MVFVSGVSVDADLSHHLVPLKECADHRSRDGTASLFAVHSGSDPSVSSGSDVIPVAHANLSEEVKSRRFYMYLKHRYLS